MLILTWVGIIFVKILHLAYARCKLMTNIMPTHVKIIIELGIRELFVKICSDLLSFPLLLLQRVPFFPWH